MTATLSPTPRMGPRRSGLDAPVRLTLVAGLRTLLVAVWDASGDPPAPEDAGPDAESGRGLVIVRALAAQWDWKKAPPARGGKVVRALLRARRLP